MADDDPATQPGIPDASPAADDADGARYAAWFHELDAWTEYWDIYHPETAGRFYFGDGKTEKGLLGRFLPREGRPPVFTAWTRMALQTGPRSAFVEAARAPEVAAAVSEVDELLTRLFAKHFGDAHDRAVQADYLAAIFRFAADTLPTATERSARIADSDPRKATAGRHTLDGDIMWFAWALHTEAAELAGDPAAHPRHALFQAGVAMGCPINFAWRGHRRTRPEYTKDKATAGHLLERGRAWAENYNAAVDEIHALFRIREWGNPG
ncbi:MAG: hypothetical protein WDM89_17170 [Rhizomicrobium sp.]